jgi:hypothetical protein
MKYYTTTIRSRFPKEKKVLGHANGEFVKDREIYFPRITHGEVISDAPVFDYFHLESYGPAEEWEWRLQDVHRLIGEAPAVSAWYISDRLKKVISRHHIAEAYHFYATKLLYKGEKLDYWMFHYGILGKSFEKDAMVDFSKSIFLDGNNQSVAVGNYAEFQREGQRVRIETSSELATQKLILKRPVDFIPMFGINNSDEVMSEKLKQAIEAENIEGLEFKELPYEIVIDG